jgi:hypothetical protein
MVYDLLELDRAKSCLYETFGGILGKLDQTWLSQVVSLFLGFHWILFKVFSENCQEFKLDLLEWGLLLLSFSLFSLSFWSEFELQVTLINFQKFGKNYSGLLLVYNSLSQKLGFKKWIVLSGQNYQF